MVVTSRYAVQHKHSIRTNYGAAGGMKVHPTITAAHRNRVQRLCHWSADWPCTDLGAKSGDSRLEGRAWPYGKDRCPLLDIAAQLFHHQAADNDLKPPTT